MKLETDNITWKIDNLVARLLIRWVWSKVKGATFYKGKKEIFTISNEKTGR